jgi:hypothetical protein
MLILKEKCARLTGLKKEGYRKIICSLPDH